MRGWQTGPGRAIAAMAVSVLMVAALAAFARPAGAAEGDTLDVDVDALGRYGVRGAAVVVDEGDGVSVAIDLEGIGVVGGHPAHLHLGTCDGFDPLPSYPLADVDADGLSLTTVPGVTLDDLLAEPFVVNVHESAAEINTVVACGNLKAAGQSGQAGAAPDAAGGTGGTTTEITNIPPAGVGGSLGDEGANATVVPLLGAVALVLAGTGLTLRRREGCG